MDKNDMSNEIWTLALWTQGLGLLIALTGFAIFSFDGAALFLWPLIVPIFPLVGVLFRQYFYEGVSLGGFELHKNRCRVTAITSYCNVTCFAWTVLFSGGVHGALTPIFLLMPHSTAIFLWKTSYWKHVLAIGILALFVYTGLLFISDKPPVNILTNIAHILVLTFTTILAIFITFRHLDITVKVDSPPGDPPK